MIGLACMTVALFYDYNKSTSNPNFVISIITLYTFYNGRGRTPEHHTQTHISSTTSCCFNSHRLSPWWCACVQWPENTRLHCHDSHTHCQVYSYYICLIYSYKCSTLHTITYTCGVDAFHHRPCCSCIHLMMCGYQISCHTLQQHIHCVTMSSLLALDVM